MHDHMDGNYCVSILRWTRGCFLVASRGIPRPLISHCEMSHKWNKHSSAWTLFSWIHFDTFFPSMSAFNGTYVPFLILFRGFSL